MAEPAAAGAWGPSPRQAGGERTTFILGGAGPALLFAAVLLGAPAEARAQEPAPEPAGEPAPTPEAPAGEELRPSDAAFESRFLDDGDVRLHYIDVGTGEPIVLIHGFSLDLELNWVASGIVSGLARAGYRVIAYDFRGHGKSAKPHDKALYGPPEVEDPVRLLDHLGISRAHVVGYSRGALIAHRLRAEHPERLRTVVLGGYGEGSGGEAVFGPSRRAELADAMAAGDYRPLVLAVAPDLPAEEVEGWHALLDERNDGRALAAAFRADGSFPPFTERELRANRVPTLSIIGEDDPFQGGVERMAEAMSHLEVVVVPGADHATTLERPEFLTAALGFLAKHGEAVDEAKRPTPSGTGRLPRSSTGARPARLRVRPWPSPARPSGSRPVSTRPCRARSA